MQQDNDIDKHNTDNSQMKVDVANDATADTSLEPDVSSKLDDNQELAKLQQQVAELKDLYVRAQAEVQNVQRRSQDEVKKARDYAISSFVKDVIVVKDYLEMALSDQSNNVDTIKTGVDLTLKQLVQVFERQLIKAIEPQLNDKLDPNLHQAVSAEEASGQEANTIVRVMQKGYMLNNRVIRPAMVVVAK